MRPRLLVSTHAYSYFEPLLLAAGNFESAAVERKVFPDGERYLRIEAETWGRDVVLLGGTPSDLDWLEVYDLGCAISRAGARSLSIVMPYFGYATMERAERPGEVVTAKTRAMLISAIPPCEAGTRMFLFDLHTDGIEFYFGDGHTTHHLYGAPVIVPLISDNMQKRPFVLGATDAGRAKWVESLARRLGVDPAFVYKRRDPSTGEVSLTGVNADVAGKEVVIYDDMIRTGTSLIQAGRAYQQAGASKVYAVASHLVLPDGALRRILDSGVISEVWGTNSHPASSQLGDSKRALASVANLFVTALDKSERGTSRKDRPEPCRSLR